MRSGTTQYSPEIDADMRVTVNSDVYATVDIGEETARLLSAYEDEQVWGGVYHFYIDNSDEALSNKDYKGKAVVVNHGFVGTAGSDIGDLWVDDQEFISREGALVLHLICIDAWGLLSRVKGTVGGAYWNLPWQDPDVLAELALPVSGEPLPATLIAAITAHWNKTVQNIVTTTISDALGMTVFLDDNDGLTTTQKPQVSSIDARSVVVQAMQVTKSYLLWKADGQFHIVEPGAHATAYSYNVADLIFNNTEEQALVIPNRVIYWFINKVNPAVPSTWVWTNGSAVDAESYGRLGIYIDEHHNLEQEFWEGISSQAEANARATARLYHIQLGKATGTLVAPMHCAQELFDKITIIDNNYTPAKTVTGYVFRIIREYDRGVYKISLQLGGVETGYTPSGGEDIRKAPKAVPIPIIPSPIWQIPKAVQGYHHDITFTSNSWSQVSWSNGTIKFYDGSIQFIYANLMNMASGLVYYIYFDLDSPTPYYLKYTTNYLSVMTLKTGVVCIAQRGSDATVKAVVIPSYGKEPLITADVIYLTGLLDKLPNGTYGKVLSTSITAGRILIDELWTSGETYGLVRQTDISAGHIKLSTTVEDGGYRRYTDTEYTKLAGIAQYADVTDGHSISVLTDRTLAFILDTTTRKAVSANEKTGASSAYDIFISKLTAYGLSIWTVNSTTRVELTASGLRGYNAGTLQVEVATDGRMYAGAGAVILDSSGITIKGQLLTLKDSGGTLRGYLEGAAGYVVLSTTSGTSIYIQAVGAGEYITLESTYISLKGAVAPYAHKTHILGDYDLRWKRVYGAPILSTSEDAVEGSVKMAGGGSGDIYIYSNGAWRTNT